MIFPYLFMMKAMIGNGMSAANVNFQLIVKPIIAMIMNMNVVESTSGILPKPAGIEIALKSFVLRAIKSPGLNFVQNVGDILKKCSIKLVLNHSSSVTEPPYNV